MEVYNGAIQNLRSKDAAKQKQALAVLEGGSDSAFDWKTVKGDKWDELLTELCNLIKSTNEESTCCRALTCANQVIRLSELTDKQIQTFLNALHCAVHKNRNFSNAVEYEAVRAVESLLDSFSEAMGTRCSEWFDLIFLRTVHASSKIRHLAMHIFFDTTSLVQQDVQLVVSCIPQLKTVIVPKMKELLEQKTDIVVLKLWGGIVHILGDLLHRGATLINTMLEVIEKAFRSSSDEMLQGAFEAWKEMIDNFSSNSTLINTTKRLQLLLKPLLDIIRVKNAEVIHAKMLTWWHLADRLGPHLQENYSMVVEPLFEFCFGKYDRSLYHNKTITTNGVNTVKDVEQRTILTSYGVHVIARICEAEKNVVGEASKCFILSPLKRYVYTGTSLLVSHPQLFTYAALKMSILDLPNESKLVYFVWKCLTNNAKTSTEAQFLKEYFRAVDIIIGAAAINVKLLFEIVELASSLPPQILFSTKYNFGCETPNTTPGTMLLRHLLGKHAADFSTSRKRFFNIFKQLTNYSLATKINVQDACRSTILLLERAATSIDDSETVCKLWQLLTNQLTVTIDQTQDVNQGDGMQHDFSCIHTALVFPFKQLSKWVVLSSLYKKTVWKIWERLYVLSVNCAAVVPKVDINIFTIELANRVKVVFSYSHPLAIEVIESYLKTALKLLEHISWDEVTPSCNPDFSPLKKLETSSPLTWNKKRTKKIYIVAPMLSLTVQIAEVLIMLDERRIETFLKGNKNFSNSVIVLLIQCFEKLCSNLKENDMLQIFFDLSPILSKVFSRSSCEDSVFAGPRILNKLENVWSRVALSLASNYSGIYNNSMLNIVSPLLEAAFQHPRKSIQSTTWTFWHSTFAACYSKLNIPKRLQKLMEELKPTLFTSHLSQDIGDDNAFNDSPTAPISDLASESLSPQYKPLTPTTPVGGFLGRKNLQLLPKSPQKARKSFRSSADDISDSDYVVIEASPTKITVVPSHRKKLRRGRPTIPAMYNNLSQESCSLEESQKIVEETPASEIVAIEKVVHNSVESQAESSVKESLASKVTEDSVISASTVISNASIVNEPAELVESAQSIASSSSSPDSQQITVIENVDVANVSSAVPDSSLPTELKNQPITLHISLNETSLENHVDNDVLENNLCPVSPSSTELGVKNGSTNEDVSAIPNSWPASSTTFGELNNCDVGSEVLSMPDKVDDRPSSAKRKSKRKLADADVVTVVKNGSKRRRVSRNILKTVSEFESAKSKKSTSEDGGVNNYVAPMDIAEVTENDTEMAIRIENIVSCTAEVSSFSSEEMSVCDLPLPPPPKNQLDSVCDKSLSLEQCSTIDSTGGSIETNVTITATNKTALCDMAANLLPTSPQHLPAGPLSCSPNGILKKITSDSSNCLSPTNKRRVSFADPPVQGEVLVNKSPVRSPNSRFLSRKNTPLYLSPKRITSIALASPLEEASSNLEAMEDDSSAIFEDLIDCTSPISSLFPYLSAVNIRGFSQLLNSKSIITVGDFSRLTKSEIQALPLQTPKLKHARQALLQFKVSLAGSSLTTIHRKSQSYKQHGEVVQNNNVTEIMDSQKSIGNSSLVLTKEPIEIIAIGPNCMSVVDNNNKSGRNQKDASSNTDVENKDAVTQTAKGPKLKATNTQTAILTLNQAGTQTKMPPKLHHTETQTLVERSEIEIQAVSETFESETQAVAETHDHGAQTNPMPKHVDSLSQTTKVVLKTTGDDTSDLVETADEVCQTYVKTKSVRAQTVTPKFVNGETQTMRGANFQCKENPFDHMFKNFCSTLSEIDDKQIGQSTFEHLNIFHKNIIEIMNNFDRRWFQVKSQLPGS